MRIGITGGTGSGKTTLCPAAVDLGFLVIDADKIGHNILLKGNEAYNYTVKLFGTEILMPNGEIDRKKLGKIVFSDSEKLELLNEITHEIITDEIERRLAENSGSHALIDAAILFESGMDKTCDITVAVIASAGIRAERIIQRDGISGPDALARIASQKDEKFYIEKADKIIYNNGNVKQLYDDGIKFFKEVTHGEF